jgi:hypothetical protein
MTRLMCAFALPSWTCTRYILTTLAYSVPVSDSNTPFYRPPNPPKCIAHNQLLRGNLLEGFQKGQVPGVEPQASGLRHMKKNIYVQPR